MNNILRKPGVWLAGTLLLFVFIILWLNSPQWARSFSSTLEGHTPRNLNTAQLVGPAQPKFKIQVLLLMNFRNEAELDKLLEQQHKPGADEFHQWLSTNEFINRFSPEQQDVDAVTEFLKQSGLTVLSVSPNRLLIHVEGEIKDFEKLFRVKINNYRWRGETLYSLDQNPVLPNWLKPKVKSITGLDNFTRYHSRMKNMKAQPANSLPPGNSPQDLGTVYDFPNQNNKEHSQDAGKVYSGNGIKIAIASAYTYDERDARAFWRQYGIQRTGTVRNIFVNGQSKQINGETTLDLEQAGAQAPGANIYMYLAPDPSFTNFALVFNQIVVDNDAGIVSISWGLNEADSGDAHMETEHAIFKQGAAQGIAFFAAAGDDGAYDAGAPSEELAVDYPAADPFITAVGGTSLTKDKDGKRKSETAWTGTGGGISSKWDRPAWQKPGNGVPDTGITKRSLSDISLVADPNTGISMYFKGKWYESGGTSFSAPATAGLWALMAEAAGGARLGPANPTLYRAGLSKEAGSIFYDITTGNNGDGRLPGYNCGPGWDYPTGWGVPIGAALIEWFVNDHKTNFKVKP